MQHLTGLEVSFVSLVPTQRLLASTLDGEKRTALVAGVTGSATQGTSTARIASCTKPITTI